MIQVIRRYQQVGVQIPTTPNNVKLESGIGNRAKAGVKNKSMLWIILVLAFRFLILGSLTAIAIAAAAIPEHLAICLKCNLQRMR